MVSFLVMKNSLKRLLSKKSTYIMMIFIPVLISMAGLFLTMAGSSKISVGIVGDQKTYEYVADRLGDNQDIILEKANPDSINTDYIMGRYDYVINNENLSILDTIEEQTEPEYVEDSDQTEKMLAMLMIAYITIVSYYSSSIIRDRNEGIISRYCYSGHRKSSYMKGTFMSVFIAAGVQIFTIVIVWQLLLNNYSLNILEIIIVGMFITFMAGIIGFASSMISKSEVMSGVLASSIAVILGIVGGAFVPYDSMPEVIQNISIISPVRWLFLILK